MFEALRKCMSRLLGNNKFLHDNVRYTICVDFKKMTKQVWEFFLMLNNQTN